MSVPSSISLILISLALLSGCQKRLHIQGNPFAHTLSASLRPGVSSQEDVEALLGTPTVINDQNWLYIFKKTQTQAFLNPDLMEQQVTMLEFNSKGILQKVSTRTQDDAHVIKVTNRVTKPAGKQDSVLQRAVKKHHRTANKER